MTLNGVIALILRYFTEFSSFWGAMRKVVQDVVKKFTFTISSLDEFLVRARTGQGLYARLI